MTLENRSPAPTRLPFAIDSLPALAVTAAASLTQIDVTAMAVALPVVEAEFGLGPIGMAWVMDVYSLAFVGLMFAAGAAADRYGRRLALVVGVCVFAAASLLGGLAWNGPSLWVARALQGAAAAFIIAGGLAMLSLAYPDPGRRARAFGLMGVVTGAAMALGPAIGGLLTASVGWRWIFLVNLPVCMAAVWTVLRWGAESCDPEGRPFDPAGLLLLSLALALPVHAILRADGTAVSRGIELAAGLAMAAAFVVQQRRRRRPMIDPLLFAQPGAIGIGLILVLLSVAYWAVLVYLPAFFQAAFGFRPDQTGIAMLVATLPMVALPALGARLVQRRGIGRTAAAAFALMAVATAALAVLAMQGSPPVAAAVALAAVAGSGAGLVNAQVSAALIAMAPAGQAGMASAVATTLRQAGYALGIACLGLAVRPGLEGGAAHAGALAVAAGAAAAGLAVAVFLPRPAAAR